MLAQAPSRVRHFLWLLLQAAAIVSASAAALAALALLILHVWLWPSMSARQEAWFSDFQSQMADRGLSVSVRSMSAQWETWFRPSIRIERLEIARSNGDRVLTVGQINAVLGPRSIASIWHWQPVFSEIRVEDPQLYAERRADGEILIAGVPLSGISRTRRPWTGCCGRADFALMRERSSGGMRFGIGPRGCATSRLP